MVSYSRDTRIRHREPLTDLIRSLTPVNTVVRAYHKALDDESLNGEALEASVNEILVLPRPELANGRFSTRAVTVWDPLFRMLHSNEPSGLPDAIC
jgi:hypothetical protein